jgi:hypothetical protein
MQREGMFNSVELEGQEKPSLTPAGDVKVKYLGKRNFLDIHNDNETGLRAENNKQAGERNWNIHRFPPKLRHASDVAHSPRIEANITATPSPRETNSNRSNIPTDRPSPSQQSSKAHQDGPTISRRTLALRAMTLRLIGYILIPVICILPSVIMDLIVKACPVGVVKIPDGVSGFSDGLNGLIGLFNTILFLLDPVLLVVWADLRTNRRWGLLRKQRVAAHNSDCEGTDAIEVDVMDESPLQDAKNPGSDGADEEVGGVRSTRVGDDRRDLPLPKRAFEDSLVSGLPDADNEPPSHLTIVGPKRPRSRGMGRRTRREAHHDGAAGLMIRVQVQVTEYSDLERVEEYLLGL